MITVDEFYKQTIGKQYDLDGVPKNQPYQCADYFKQACKMILGEHWATGGDGYVDYFWYNRRSHHANDLVFITDYRDLRNGDFVIWPHSKRSSKTPFSLSHIAMYYNGNMVGQNQPYKYVNSKPEPVEVWKKMLGAIRFKAWHQKEEENMHRSNNDLEQINIHGTEKSTRKIATSFHVYRKKDVPVTLVVKKFKFEKSDITAVQIVMDQNVGLELSYIGKPDWLCSLHNDWMLENGYEEIACVNAGYFEMATGKPVGAVLTNWSGKWSQFNGVDCVPSKNNGYPTLSWNGEEMKLLNEYASNIDLTKYAWLCGVGQSLLIDGKIDNSIGVENGRFKQNVNATAIGYNHKTHILTMAINSNGTLNTTQRSELMRTLGCDIAVQLDGGESAQLEWLAKAMNGSVPVEKEETEKEELTLEERVARLEKKVFGE